MIALNLNATTAEQTVIKDYLENNVSEALAEKINNGVRIEKDGRMLISKKDLSGFMKYACGEAQKQAEKGARYACVDNNTVFGWALRFFQEDSIEGILYNEDGSTYTLKPVVTSSKAVPASIVKPKLQGSLFDLIQTNTAAETQAEESTPDEPESEEADFEGPEPEESVIEEPPEELLDEQEEPPKLIQISETEYADADGVVYEIPKETNNPIPGALSKLLGDALIAG